MNQGDLSWIKSAASGAAILGDNLKAGGLSWLDLTRAIMDLVSISQEVPALISEVERLRREVNELKLCLEESAENGGTWNV